MKKKIGAILLTLTLIFGLTACGNSNETTNSTAGSQAEENQTETETESGEPQTETAASDGSVLIAYFSQTGNTETIANMIAEQTGGDLFHIETVETYPDDHMELIEVAQEEQDENARPELQGTVENMDQYDTVFIGFPNWWADMPMGVYTFLESYDWNGKTVIPFCTHGGSGLSNTESSIADICTGAELLDGLAVSDTNIDGAGSDVQEWVAGLGL